MTISQSIAVIPARSGSKRIPRKNVMDFMGRPMMSYTIAAARASGAFKRIVVSTDDPQIAQIAIEEGADAPFLRDRFADDHAAVSLATLRAVEQAREHFLEDYGIIVQLMPNCPLRGHHEINVAIEHFKEVGAEFLLSAFRFGWMNPWWAVTLDSQGHPKRIIESPSHERSQDLPTLFCPSGAIWIARTASLLEARTFYGPGHIYLEFPWEVMVDIDDADDLAFAEAVWLRRRKQDNIGQRA